MAILMEREGRIIPGKEAEDFIENLIDSNTQVQDNWIDLTLKHVNILESSGSMDFSGKEYAPGRLRKHPIIKKPEERFGWWALGGGQYVIEFNEEIFLPEDKIAIIQPRPELTANESSHATLIITSKEQLYPITLSIGPPGINLKQNARISRMFVMNIGPKQP